MASRTLSDEQAPQRPQPALISELTMDASESRLDSSDKTDCMNSGRGAGWCSSGVPAMGTKGTTNGYTPSSIKSRQNSRISLSESPSPARM